jgi:beta-alanine degradation protein BauB
MKSSIRITTSVVLLVLTAFCASSAMAQDPARVAPNMYKVLLNNARVRVLEVNAKAGEKAAMHWHPDYVVYSFTDSKARFTDPKGASTDADLKAGQVMWRDAERHSTEAITDIHVLLFELKGRKRAGMAARGIDAAAVDSAHFTSLLDNARVRVLDFRQAAGEKSAMHSHPDYITYNFTDSKTKFTYPKAKSVERPSKAGDVVFHRAETHAGENIGGAEIHVLLVELK